MITTPHLLITDDDRAFRETVQGMFEPRGIATLMAANGEEAVKIVKQTEVHLVLMDFQMPRLTGIEALRQLRATSVDLPCILISGAIDDSVLAQAHEASVYSILEKPASVVEIRNSVRSALFEVYGWTLAN